MKDFGWKVCAHSPTFKFLPLRTAGQTCINWSHIDPHFADMNRKKGRNTDMLWFVEHNANSALFVEKNNIITLTWLCISLVERKTGDVQNRKTPWGESNGARNSCRCDDGGRSNLTFLTLKASSESLGNMLFFWNCKPHCWRFGIMSFLAYSSVIWRGLRISFRKIERQTDRQTDRQIDR